MRSYYVCQIVWTRVAKRETSLFNNFFSNVAKHVKRCCCRFTETLVIFIVIYPGCRSGAWRWRARPGTSGARTSERWKSAGGGRRNAAGNTRKRTTAGTGKLTERFRTFGINSKLLSCIMFNMLFHVIFLFWDLNTYKRILKDYPLRTKNRSFSLPISSFTRDYAGI